VGQARRASRALDAIFGGSLPNSTSTKPDRKLLEGLVVRDLTLGDQIAEPVSAVLDRPLLLVLEVAVDDPEALTEAHRPLEVVEQRPCVVTAHVDAFVDRPRDLAD